MRLTDRIWAECGERNLTGIDDIEKIQLTSWGLEQLCKDYFLEFGEEIKDKTALSEHIAMPIEIVEFIEDEQEKQYKICTQIF